jgi:2-polyprenyl-6-methoxyphenol hydroxylase-like FAD-dependent oxidoreductase
MSDNHKETVHSAKKFFRWGIYTRPLLKKYFAKNITLFGDAAHPIVPFLGQGGCLAIEDGYSFAKLLSDIGNLEDTQNSYERIRKPRVKMITRLSKEQALHNHISNPLLKKTRNLLMSKTPIIDKQMDRIYKFEL